MPHLTFGYLREYLSTSGRTLERWPHYSGEVYCLYRVGNPLSGNWRSFKTLADVKKWVTTYA